jgi:hypothetical protein
MRYVHFVETNNEAEAAEAGSPSIEQQQHNKTQGTTTIAITNGCFAMQRALLFDFEFRSREACCYRRHAHYAYEV